MLNVRFTPDARADLDGIIVYTLERFGIAQAQTYRAGFEKFFEILATYPQAGSDQSDIRPGLRRIVHQAHAIYYRVEGDNIVIGRILGPGQDPLQEL